MEIETKLPSRKPRSRNGCVTCRIRKVKCDEQRPVCQKCTNRPVKCEWLEPGCALSARRARSYKSSAAQANSSRNSPRRLALLSPVSVEYGSPLGEVVTSRESQSPLSGALITHQTPRPTLSTYHMPLFNSLQLSADDQAAFLYIPDSILVLSYGKLWQWSCFSYIYTNIASQYPGVMRGFIAVAEMEFRAREKLAAQDGADPIGALERANRMGSAASMHYSAALKDLSSLLDLVCHSEAKDRDIEALFTMWFLILKFEAYDSESPGSSLLHLDGIRSFLAPYMQTSGYANGKKLPHVSQPMLLYTLYLDADSAAGDINGGRFCRDLLSRNANDLMSHENLFRSVRSVLPKIWGEAYPVSELLDDLENYRPLRLYHLCQAARLELLKLARSSAPGPEDILARRRLWQHIQNFGDEFTDIILLAKSAPNSGGKRLLWTVYAAALDFYALQVVYLKLNPEEQSQAQVNPILDQMLRIASKGLREDARQIYRFIWALSVALHYTKDHTNEHKQWLSVQLARARVLLPTFNVADLAL